MLKNFSVHDVSSVDDEFASAKELKSFTAKQAVSVRDEAYTKATSRAHTFQAVQQW
jgi:hypothetical protein